MKLQSLFSVRVNANYPGCWMLLSSSAAVSVLPLPQQISEAVKVEPKLRFKKRASDQFKGPDRVKNTETGARKPAEAGLCFIVKLL